MHFTDLHNHLLPGVDDGSRSLDESLRHLTSLARDGVRRLAFSPHLHGWLVDERGDALGRRLDLLRGVFDDVREAAASSRASLPELALGHEILLRDERTARRLLRHAGLGHGGSRYILMEFGFELPDDCPGIIAAVLDAGRRPMVAHPERYRRRGERVGLAEIESWKDAGALLQVNAGSLAGRYAPGIDDLAWRLVADGLADLMGSDNHADNRPQSPLEAARLLAARGGEAQAELLLHTNPDRVLDDDELLAVPPLPEDRAVA